MMVVLRRTQKLARTLPLSENASAPSDTALGDWYVNRLTVDRRPLLLLVSSCGLLPIVLPARDVASLPARLPEIVAARLSRLDLAHHVMQSEVGAMLPVLTGRTVNRSVVGIMVDFARMLPMFLDRGWEETSLAIVEAELGQTPCHAGRRFEEVVFPDRDASRLVIDRWGTG